MRVGDGPPAAGDRPRPGHLRLAKKAYLDRLAEMRQPPMITSCCSELPRSRISCWEQKNSLRRALVDNNRNYANIFLCHRQNSAAEDTNSSFSATSAMATTTSSETFLTTSSELESTSSDEVIRVAIEVPEPVLHPKVPVPKLVPLPKDSSDYVPLAPKITRTGYDWKNLESNPDPDGCFWKQKLICANLKNKPVLTPTEPDHLACCEQDTAQQHVSEAQLRISCPPPDLIQTGGIRLRQKSRSTDSAKLRVRSAYPARGWSPVSVTSRSLSLASDFGGTTETLSPPLNENRTCGRTSWDWEYRSVNLLKVAGYGFGIAVSGGKDNPHFTNGDPSIVISDVLKSGPASGLLEINDRIISANARSMENVDYSNAVEILKNSDRLSLIVKRKVPIPSIELEQRTLKFTLTKSKKKEDFGIVLGCKYYIKDITNQKLAEKEPGLRENDVVLKINGRSCEDLSFAEAKKLLEKASENLSLVVQRDIPRGTTWKWPSQNTIYERVGNETPLRHSAAPSPVSTSRRSRASSEGHDHDTTSRPVPRRHKPRHMAADYANYPSYRHSLGSNPPSQFGTPVQIREIRDIRDEHPQSTGYPQRPVSGVLITTGCCSAPQTPNQSHRRAMHNSVHLPINGRHHDAHDEFCSSSAADPAAICYKPPLPLPIPEPRQVFFQKDGGSVGIRVVGGNEAGIFVSAVQGGSPAAVKGVRAGDKILRANGKDFKDLTREEAVLFLLGIMDQVELLLQYRREDFERIRTQNLGDNFYVRAHFDYEVPELPGEMAFKRGEILQVTDTLCGGSVGSWQATKVYTPGGVGTGTLGIEQPTPGATFNEPFLPSLQLKGVIPNLVRAEKLAAAQILQLSKSMVCDDDETSTAAKTGIFRWRKGPAIGGASSVALGPGTPGERRSKPPTKGSWDDYVLLSRLSLPPPSAYEKVKLKHPGYPRPVVLFGSLSDIARQRLLQELPSRFSAPKTDSERDEKRASSKDRSKASKEATTPVLRLVDIKDIMSTGKHCLLDITPSSVERLCYAQYCPIVIFINVDSKNRIRDLRQFYGKSAITKNPRKLMDEATKIQKGYGHLFTAVMDASQEDRWFEALRELIFHLQDRRVWLSETRPLETLEDDFLFPLMTSSSGGYHHFDSDNEDAEPVDISRNSTYISTTPGGQIVLTPGSVQSTHHRPDNDNYVVPSPHTLSSGAPSRGQGQGQRGENWPPQNMVLPLKQEAVVLRPLPQYSTSPPQVNSNHFESVRTNHVQEMKKRLTTVANGDAAMHQHRPSLQYHGSPLQHDKDGGAGIGGGGAVRTPPHRTFSSPNAHVNQVTMVDEMLTVSVDGSLHEARKEALNNYATYEEDKAIQMQSHVRNGVTSSAAIGGREPEPPLQSSSPYPTTRPFQQYRRPDPQTRNPDYAPIGRRTPTNINGYNNKVFAGPVGPQRGPQNTQDPNYSEYGTRDGAAPGTGTEPMRNRDQDGSGPPQENAFLRNAMAAPLDMLHHVATPMPEPRTTVAAEGGSNGVYNVKQILANHYDDYENSSRHLKTTPVPSTIVPVNQATVPVQPKIVQKLTTQVPEENIVEVSTLSNYNVKNQSILISDRPSLADRFVQSNRFKPDDNNQSNLNTASAFKVRVQGPTPTSSEAEPANRNGNGDRPKAMKRTNVPAAFSKTQPPFATGTASSFAADPQASSSCSIPANQRTPPSSQAPPTFTTTNQRKPSAGEVTPTFMIANQRAATLQADQLCQSTIKSAIQSAVVDMAATTNERRPSLKDLANQQRATYEAPPTVTVHSQRPTCTADYQPLTTRGFVGPSAPTRGLVGPTSAQVIGDILSGGSRATAISQKSIVADPVSALNSPIRAFAPQTVVTTPSSTTSVVVNAPISQATPGNNGSVGISGDQVPSGRKSAPMTVGRETPPVSAAALANQRFRAGYETPPLSGVTNQRLSTGHKSPPPFFSRTGHKSPPSMFSYTAVVRHTNKQQPETSWTGEHLKAGPESSRSITPASPAFMDCAPSPCPPYSSDPHSKPFQDPSGCDPAGGAASDSEEFSTNSSEMHDANQSPPGDNHSNSPHESSDASGGTAANVFVANPNFRELSPQSPTSPLSSPSAAFLTAEEGSETSTSTLHASRPQDASSVQRAIKNYEEIKRSQAQAVTVVSTSDMSAAVVQHPNMQLPNVQSLPPRRNPLGPVDKLVGSILSRLHTSDGKDAAALAAATDDRNSNSSKTSTKSSKSSSTSGSYKPDSSETIHKLPSMTLSETSSSTSSQKKVIAAVEAMVGYEGGTLRSPETGVAIHIPEGALPPNTLQRIYFKVCEDSNLVPPLNKAKGEALLSPVVICGPQGLVFKKPVELRLPPADNSVSPDKWSFALKSTGSTRNLDGTSTGQDWQHVPLSEMQKSQNGKLENGVLSVFIDHF